MTRLRAAAWIVLTLACSTPGIARAAFQVVLEVDGTDSATFDDPDLDGVIDFDTTVGGVFVAKGQVKQDLNPHHPGAHHRPEATRR